MHQVCTLKHRLTRQHVRHTGGCTGRHYRQGKPEVQLRKLVPHEATHTGTHRRHTNKISHATTHTSGLPPSCADVPWQLRAQLLLQQQKVPVLSKGSQ
jgi:hypothetical protein